MAYNIILVPDILQSDSISVYIAKGPPEEVELTFIIIPGYKFFVYILDALAFGTLILERLPLPALIKS